MTRGLTLLGWVGALTLLATAVQPATAEAQEGVRWHTDLNEARREAQESGKLILLHFWDTWCGPCKKMDESTFQDPQVAQAMHANYVPVKMQISQHKELAEKIAITNIPCDLFVTVEGRVVARTHGYLNSERYSSELYRIAGISGRPNQDIYVANRGTSVPASGPAPSAPPPAQPRPENAPPRPDTAQSQSPQHQQPRPQGQPEAPRFASNSPESHRPGGAAPSPTLADREDRNRPEPQQPQLPPLAMDGFCVVALNGDAPSWIEGDPRWGVIHQGRLYLFSSEEAKQSFWKEPDRYAPVFSGDDVVEFVEGGRRLAGERAYGVFFEDRVYLFASETSRDKFEDRPEHYAENLKQAISRMTRR